MKTIYLIMNRLVSIGGTYVSKCFLKNLKGIGSDIKLSSYNQSYYNLYLESNNNRIYIPHYFYTQISLQHQIQEIYEEIEKINLN